MIPQAFVMFQPKHNVFILPSLDSLGLLSVMHSLHLVVSNHFYTLKPSFMLQIVKSY